jgi:hypothetical protein
MPERLTEMEDENFERQKEFILQQQAQFAAKIGQLEGNLARLSGTVERQGENIERLTGVVERVVDAVARLAQVTAERFATVEGRADETDRKIVALVDAQIQTEETVRKMGERIDNLAVVVERHIAEGHNGRTRPEA